MATQIIITDAGRAALVAAGNGGTNAHQVVEIGLANAPFVADKGLTKLPNELKRIKSFGGANVAPDTIHTTLKDDSTDQYSLYGFGLYLENGVLLAAYGQTTPIMEKSPAALLLLSSDMQFTALDATQLVFGDASFLNPPATTDRQGVVELATQAEVDTGSDDTRAVTPKTAAARYAALTGAKFTGPVVTEFDAGPDTAHVSIRPPSGKTGRESRLRLHGTFGGNNADTGTRLIATIRSGFDNGAWGREYVDLWLNRTGNDNQSDANQARALRVGYGGRVLVGDVKNDDGNSRLRVGGDIAVEGTSNSKNSTIDGGAGNFSTLFFADGGKFRWSMFKRDGAATGGNNGNDFGMNAFADDGVTQFPAFRVSRGNQTFSVAKRLTVGDIGDDGRNAIQVGGSATFAGGLTAREMDATGSHFRAISNGYGAFLRNDGKDVYLLSTDKGDPDGQWNDFRPFSWSLISGNVLINGNGASTNIGGDLVVGKTTDEGRIRVGPTDGYFYANAQTVGWWRNNDSFQYFMEDRTFRVNGKRVWHAGNLTPLDRATGGTLSGDLQFDAGKRLFLSEGSAQVPSLTFINDGAPDTGLYHINDGSFGVTCNATAQVTFTPGGTVFQTPVRGPTPAAGDRSTALATTEWVLAALSTTSVGQIIFEPRTSVRAGFLKANGALVKRADYPALWAYAQASGALVTEDEWPQGLWASFSSGDGSTTFRLPELRGEFIRCWDDARGIDANRILGSWQDSANRSHGHGASAAAVGDHAHSAWTDAQGWHGHHGWTGGAGGHNHNNGAFSRLLRPPYGGSLTGSDQAGSGSEQAVGPGDSQDIVGVGDHGHEFNTEGAGTHGHNVGIGAAGNHSHAITVNLDGANESRSRNVALLALIRAY
ncbi:putative phage tail protein [Burkholderia lata]|uniref:Putative phage tail protein n=1 Tax=Burkholderia lata (strain ATCC 17760 / DSM 23089 / LMG 22485 / NCIMB 9086 / R18194 / 383) TaxID=482957 RepID=A0A6P2SPV4_BURL3|nr:phage tail protein [Burkholderia lata]VWC47685.1 putative phage tail protein [Burkholderia lata]